MLEGNAVEGKSQKVNDKAVPAATDVPGTLGEKMPSLLLQPAPGQPSQRGPVWRRGQPKQALWVLGPYDSH